MLVNLSLILLTYQSTHLSPIITSYGSTLPSSYKFNNLNIFRIFNSFYYQKYCKVKKKISVSNSLFSHTLNSVFLLSSDSDTIFTTQIHVINEGSINNNPLTVTNCCFTQCSATDPSYINGTAIYSVLPYASITAISTVFVKCSAPGFGGSIYTTGQEIKSESSLFADCQCSKSGSAIFFEKVDWAEATINQTLFINNVCQGSTVYSSVAGNHCTNSNFTHNTNKGQYIHQQVSSVYFFWNQRNIAYDFVCNNLALNDGDALIDFRPGDYRTGKQIEFVNFVGNVNVFFFFFYNEISPNDNPLLAHFAFFGNTAAVPGEGVKIANEATVSHLVLADCLFEYEEAVVHSMLNGHELEGGSFAAPKTNFAQSGVFNQPTKCEVDIGFATMSKEFSKSSAFSETFEFSESSTFSASSQFSPSSYFSPSLLFSQSKRFSLSSFFSKSKLFLPSSSFTSSSHFTSSSSFTPSSMFSSSSSFSASSIFSPSNLLLFRPSSKTDEFTASSPFTPSNVFTPNRTKVPDPPGFNRAAISGRNKDIFSKEEIKKAAAPVSISLVLIIVSIVLCILYIKRKVKAVMNQDNVPDFDTSFESDEYDDSDYSYSYYTYSYYYVDNEYDRVSYSESYSTGYYSDVVESDIDYSSDFFGTHGMVTN